MTPAEQIKAIETLIKNRVSLVSPWLSKDQAIWLIARVMRLTAALERIKTDRYELNPWTTSESDAARIAREALEDSDGA